MTRHVAGKGALGGFFAQQLGGTIKMGDTPSVAWLLKGTPQDPAQPGWGGRFTRAWERPWARLDRIPDEKDRIEQFGILELVLPLGADAPEHPDLRLIVENQELPGHAPGDGSVRFRFCPKDAKVYQLRIRGNVPGLDGTSGAITVVAPAPAAARQPSTIHLNWWTDDPAPEFAEGAHAGARTVSQWRRDFLLDFAKRMRRCE